MTAALLLLLASCDVPARVGNGAVTTWIPPDVGPQLAEVPAGDLNINMVPGTASPEEIDLQLSELRGYVEGSGIHLATYPGASRVDIYQFVAIDAFGGPGPDGPMTCFAEVAFGEPVSGFSCGGPADEPAEHGILSMGLSESERGDYTMTIEVGSAAENVVIETTTGYTIVISPAGGVAYAEWNRHRPLRIAVFHDDGTTVSEILGP